MPLPVIVLDTPEGRHAAEDVVARLRLDPRELFRDTPETSVVRGILADVAERGDDALVDAARKYDDPDFEAADLVADADELAAAHRRVDADLRDALRQAIGQVRAYQQHIMPAAVEDFVRGGVRLGLRYTPLDSAGCYVPGGKASYPSSLIHLVVPAQVAGVRDVVVTTPPSVYGRSDLVLAAAHELGLRRVFRVGGAAAVGALAFGTQSVPRVDKIVGPGNTFVQIAKRLVAGGVAVDGYLGPSEVLVFADESADPRYVAADLLAQAEHDPGSCYLLSTDVSLPQRVNVEIERQLATLSRADAARRALTHSAAVVSGDVEALVVFANRLAAEHVSVQTRDPRATLEKIVHAGCAFLGPLSPIAAGDYVAGPSHCLPTNTTARFGGGISVLEFLKRGGVVAYTRAGLASDAAAALLADAEGLDAHAASIRVRLLEGDAVP